MWNQRQGQAQKALNHTMKSENQVYGSRWKKIKCSAIVKCFTEGLFSGFWWWWKSGNVPLTGKRCFPQCLAAEFSYEGVQAGVCRS